MTPEGLKHVSEQMLALHLAMIGDTDPSMPGTEVEQTDESYGIRNGLVYIALGYAQQCGHRHGLAPDTMEPGWVVAYIDLPEGQVSWHLPQYPGDWDLHGTDEKYARIRAYRERVEG